MQDTILTLCKDSVKEFVEFMMKYIPKETRIISTYKVENVFEKAARSIEREEQEDNEEIPEDQLTNV